MRTVEQPRFYLFSNGNTTTPADVLADAYDTNMTLLVEAWPSADLETIAHRFAKAAGIERNEVVINPVGPPVG